MTDVNAVAIVVAAAAVFVVSAVWYIAFGSQLAELHPAYAEAASEARPARMGGGRGTHSEPPRCFGRGRTCRFDRDHGLDGGMQLGFSLCIGFPVVLWTGAIMHEKVPPKLAAIHAGDWLLKLRVIAVIVSVWR
jgi:hypothetical protein